MKYFCKKIKPWFYSLFICLFLTNSVYAIQNVDYREDQQWQTKEKDLFIVSNAMYDFFIKVDHETLNKYSSVYNIKKGFSGIIDRKSMHSIINETKIFKQAAAGGSTNTALGMVSFGGSATFNSVASLDNIGKKFYASIQESGVVPIIKFREEGSTGVVIVFVTPEGDRTMFSSQGVGINFQNTDIDYGSIKDHKILLTDAYSLLDKNFKPIFLNLISEAKKHNTHVAFSLSANYVATQHREFIKTNIPNIDIIFGSKYEVMALFDSSDFEQAILEFQKIGNIGIFTMGGDGALIITKDDLILIPAEKVKTVDSTGAGDMFAAGFLYGYSKGFSLKACGDLGSKAAAYIIQQEGVHPREELHQILSSFSFTKHS